MTNTNGQRISLTLICVLLLSGCVRTTLDQTRVFQPGPCRTGTVTTAQTQPFDVDTGSIVVADEVALRAVTLRHAEARGTLIYFGGNSSRHCAQLLTDTANAALLRNLASLGLNVVLVNYRGYAGSQGKPNFDVVKQDAFAVYDHVVASDLRAPIIVQGQSLGTLFAATLAAHRPISRVVLESPPTTYAEVISAALPWYAKPFVRVRLTPDVARESTLPVVARVYQPTLVLVGSKDPVTPPRMARRVHAALAAQQKDLRVIRGGRHGDLVNFEDYWSALRGFMRRPDGGASHH